MRDFTLAAYLAVVRALQARELPIFGVRDWLREQPARGALIRHDVDRRPHNALRMAQAEARAGLRTTYYFRVVGSAYDLDVIRAVHQLGHEVGYHYEDLALARGDVDAALASFEKHLAALRAVAPIETIAMHGSPLSRHNNLDLWRHAQPSRFGIVADAFLSVDYAATYYFTDTGRSWGATATNLRDWPPGALAPASPVRDSPALCRFIARGDAGKIAISAHPERWDATLPGWLFQGAKDGLINVAKVALSRMR